MKNLKLIWLVLFACLCAGSVLAQEKLNQCENFGSKKSAEKKITFNVVNEDFKNVLNFLTEQFGCKFLVDKSVKFSTVTENFKDYSLEFVLFTLIEKQNLGMMIKEGTDAKSNNKSKFIFISTKEKILREIECSIKDCFSGKTLESDALYTEFIRLNNFPVDRPYYYYCYATPEQIKNFPPIKIIQLVKKLLSPKGILETDSRTNSLIITDTKERVMSIRKQVKKWDNSGIPIEEILKDFESKNGGN
jgi:type II secretory pathway component GspD/PulD (secretin)